MSWAQPEVEEFIFEVDRRWRRCICFWMCKKSRRLCAADVDEVWNELLLTMFRKCDKLPRLCAEEMGPLLFCIAKRKMWLKVRKLSNERFGIVSVDVDNLRVQNGFDHALGDTLRRRAEKCTFEGLQRDTLARLRDIAWELQGFGRKGCAKALARDAGISFDAARDRVTSLQRRAANPKFYTPEET